MTTIYVINERNRTSFTRKMYNNLRYWLIFMYLCISQYSTLSQKSMEMKRHFSSHVYKENIRLQATSLHRDSFFSPNSCSLACTLVCGRQVCKRVNIYFNGEIIVQFRDKDSFPAFRKRCWLDVFVVLNTGILHCTLIYVHI